MNSFTKIKLHLGCGTTYKEGYINVDSSPHVKKDVEWNLDKYPWPFKTNSVDYILANAVIEHLFDFKSFMEEVHQQIKQMALELIQALCLNVYVGLHLFFCSSDFQL